MVLASSIEVRSALSVQLSEIAVQAANAARTMSSARPAFVPPAIGSAPTTVPTSSVHQTTIPISLRSTIPYPPLLSPR